MIEVKHVVKTFDGFRALDDLTMTVPDGAIYGLVGPNGAGKSTILRHITGVFRQDSGEVLVERALADLQDNVVKMQVVFQEKELPKLPDDLEVLHVSQVGRIHTLIIRGNATEVTNRLAVYAPILMDALPLTLEEIFIYELGGEDYEVRDIVL